MRNLSSIFLDMDCTLCDTGRSNDLTLQDFKQALLQRYPNHPQATTIPDIFIDHIYKRKVNVEWDSKMMKCTEEKDRRRMLLCFIMEEVLDHTPDSSHIHEFEDYFQTRRQHHYHFFEGVAEMLKRLRNTYTLVVITNGPVYSQHPRLAAVEMHKHVDHIVVGGEQPEQKPACSIFQTACSMANCTPSQAIHVGDSYSTDITGAINSGITSVWLNPEKKFLPAHQPVPDHQLTNILELEALIETLTC